MALSDISSRGAPAMSAHRLSRRRASQSSALGLHVRAQAGGSSWRRDHGSSRTCASRTFSTRRPWGSASRSCSRSRLTSTESTRARAEGLGASQQRELEERVAERTDEVRRATRAAAGARVPAADRRSASRTSAAGSSTSTLRRCSGPTSCFRCLASTPRKACPTPRDKPPCSRGDLDAPQRRNPAQHRDGRGIRVDATLIRRDGERRIAVARAETMRGASGKIRARDRDPARCHPASAPPHCSATARRCSARCSRTRAPRSSGATRRGPSRCSTAPRRSCLDTPRARSSRRRRTIIFHDMAEARAAAPSARAGARRADERGRRVHPAGA